MNGKLNIGVVGLGRLGSLYANYFANRLPDANLVAVSDVRQEVAQQIAHEYGAKSWYCLLYTSPSPRDRSLSRMPSSA